MKNKIERGTLEKRSLCTELRAESQGDEMALVGRACSYNMLSRDLGNFREQIAPGAFSRSMSAPDFDCKALFNHDPSQVLGRTANGTLSLSDSASGLNFRVQLNAKSQAHRDLWESVKRGDVSECSFAFTCDDDEWDSIQQDGATIARRTVKSARLLDVSAVTYPAYAGGATAVSARSFDYGSAPETREALLARVLGQPATWEQQKRAHELAMEILGDLNKRDDSDDDEDEDDRSVTDFLAARFGPSRFGHAARYVPMSNDSANASSLPADVIAMDFNTGALVKFRVYRDDDGNLACDEPNFYSEGA